MEAAAQAAATPLDRVHVAMLLQAGERAPGAIKAYQDRGSDFLRLAHALSTLDPEGSDEKRLLEAMLLALPRRRWKRWELWGNQSGCRSMRSVS